jgi:hypothetical protein
MAKFKTLALTLFCVSLTAFYCSGATISRLAQGKSGSTSINSVIAEIETAITSAESELLTSATPTNAVAASGTLTISGVADDAETVTIRSDVYEFAADAAQGVGAGNIAVDITSYTTASAGTLTFTNQATSADTMTIGTKVYTFVPNGTATADGEISIGTSLITAQSNIVAAINGTDGINTASTVATAAAFNATSNSVITALIGGTAGDLIATTETFTDAGNVFDAATLGTTVAGVDCTAANAVTAIVAASASGTEAVTLADGAGDTVTVTADTKGTAGNAITTTETMANGAFGAATLESGVDGTIGSAGQLYYDGTYLYITVSDNTISGANWRRISLGTAY